jgi:uncharacterized protein (TIGR02284 family)
MTLENDELVRTLKKLFEVCHDGESAYHIAVHGVKAEGPKALLQGHAQRLAQYAAELQAEVERLGSHAIKSGTVGGALHQGWAALKSAVTGGDDKALLAECARAEDAAGKEYEEALGQDLPADVRALVQRQLAGIAGFRDALRMLELAAQ